MRAALSAIVLTLAVAGCSTLPTEGQVRSRAEAGSGSGAQAPYFAPPGPTRGDDREGIVRGFLLAMQANPPSTAIARTFLSEKAAATWKPADGTIVYDGSSVEVDGDLIRTRLSDAHRLDPRGRWDTEAAPPLDRFDFSLVREGGEWRIDNPTNALAVPASYFPSLFVPFHLYFFDRSGSVLVPERVYLPRGEQTATNLLRGLLAGPRASETAALTTAIPDQPDAFGRGVLVSDTGVAEVPVGQGVLRLSETELGRVVAQLAWTLRQVPGITRLRLTVGGINVPLPNDQTDASVRTGAQYDPVAAPVRTPVALVGRRVVRVEADAAVPVEGPFGKTGFALRSVASAVDLHQIAAVAANGRVLYVAPDRGPSTASRVRTPLTGGTDLLRPTFDRFGALWTVDRTAAGAVVHLVRDGVDRVVTIDDVSGRRVTGFTVTSDGARFVAALAGDVPRVVVASLVRGPGGDVIDTGRSTTVDAGGSGLGSVVDLGQSGETTLAVLTQPEGGPGRIVHLELDGSPGEPAARTVDLLPGPVRALAVSPDPDLQSRVVTVDGLLLVQDEAGQWVPSALTGVRAVAFPD